MTDKQFDECMRRMKKGDKGALKEVYECYLPYIYTIILGVVLQKENAEDITSEFFIKLWDIADSYKPGGGHRAWLARIAKNLSIDFLRKNKREVLTDITDETASDAVALHGSSGKSEGNPAKNVTSESEVEEEVVQEISIKEALSGLSEKEREVVHLKVMGELSFKEIAGLLSEPMGTITWRYQNAMKKLRRFGYE